MQDQFKNYPKDYLTNLKNAIKAAEKELENTPKCNCSWEMKQDTGGWCCQTKIKREDLIDGIISMSQEAGLI